MTSRENGSLLTLGVISVVPLTIVAAAGLVWSAAAVLAQPPLPGVAGGAEKNLARLPNDQVEGTIWEYRGTLLKPMPEAGTTPPELKGRIRLEGKAVFDASPRVTLPSAEKVKGALAPLREGKSVEVPLPEGPQPKRLGEYRRLSTGKVRLDLSDPESLNGLMLIWRKKDTADVWMGTFAEREGKKTVREWTVELRPISD
jgi:hypothetical protein